MLENKIHDQQPRVWFLSPIANKGSTSFDPVSDSLQGPKWLISAKDFLWLPNPSAIYNNLSYYNHFSAPDPVQAVFGGVPALCLRSVTHRRPHQLALYTPVCRLTPPPFTGHLIVLDPHLLFCGLTACQCFTIWKNRIESNVIRN